MNWGVGARAGALAFRAIGIRIAVQARTA